MMTLYHTTHAHIHVHTSTPIHPPTHTHKILHIMQRTCKRLAAVEGDVELLTPPNDEAAVVVAAGVVCSAIGREVKLNGLNVYRV